MSAIALRFYALLPVDGQLTPFTEEDLLAPRPALRDALLAAAATNDGLGGALLLSADDAPPLVLVDSLSPAIISVCLLTVPQVLAGAAVAGPAHNHAGGWRFTPLTQEQVAVQPIGGVYPLGSLFAGRQGSLVIAPRRAVAEALVACAQRYIQLLSRLDASAWPEMPLLRKHLAPAERALVAYLSTADSLS